MKTVITLAALILAASSAQACDIRAAQREVREASTEVTAANGQLSYALGNSDGIDRDDVKTARVHVQNAVDTLGAAVLNLTGCEQQG